MSATGQAAGGEGQAQGEGQQAQTGPDMSALVGKLDQLSAGQDEIRGWFDQQRQAQEGQQQEADPLADIDLSFLDEGLGLNPAVSPEQVNQQFAEQVGRVADQRAQALVAPLQQQLQQMEHNQRAADLVNEFPALAEQATAEQVVKASHEWASQHFPPEIAKVVANHPGTWRQMYMAQQAAESANQSSADGTAAHLESGNGAGPGAQQQVDRVKQIRESGGRGSSVLNGI